jgi:DNA repair exonuclease SbcCD ATPase subunit
MNHTPSSDDTAADTGADAGPDTGADAGPEPAERIETAADELYGVPPDDFVPVRDELVAEAKEAGDKEAAKVIGRLRRPTQAAWLSNLLARERGDQLDALLDLGDELSSAQKSLDGQQLRQLSAQRSKLVGAMAREARRIAAADGHRITETVERDLRGILDAALADPDIADEVRSGRLTRTVSWSGFGPDDGESALGGWTAQRTGGTAREHREARERRAPRSARRPAPGRPGHGLPGVEPRRGRRPGGADSDDGGAGSWVDDTDTGTDDRSDADRSDADRAGRGRSDAGRAGRGRSDAGRAGRGRPEQGATAETGATAQERAAAERREREERERAEREERERRERERAEAEKAVAQARRDSERAADAEEDAAAALRDAESDRDEATARVEQLTAELERARDARTAAAATVKDAAQTERQASRAARDAAAALAQAEARLDELQ